MVGFILQTFRSSNYCINIIKMNVLIVKYLRYREFKIYLRFFLSKMSRKSDCFFSHKSRNNRLSLNSNIKYIITKIPVKNMILN